MISLDNEMWFNWGWNDENELDWKGDDNGVTLSYVYRDKKSVEKLAQRISKKKTDRKCGKHKIGRWH